jgi:hypothetical protein
MKRPTFISRWQEFAVWLPVLVILSIGGWVVFGALDQRITADALAWLLELPILCAYLAAACGAAWLVKFTYLFDLSCPREDALHSLVQQGDEHARWLLVKDRLEWAFLLVLFVAFFWPAR